jgi:hypothetical protein
MRWCRPNVDPMLALHSAVCSEGRWAEIAGLIRSYRCTRARELARTRHAARHGTPHPTPSRTPRRQEVLGRLPASPPSSSPSCKTVSRTRRRGDRADFVERGAITHRRGGYPACTRNQREGMARSRPPRRLSPGELRSGVACVRDDSLAPWGIGSLPSAKEDREGRDGRGSVAQPGPRWIRRL